MHDTGTCRHLLLIEIHPLILISEKLILYLFLKISHMFPCLCFLDGCSMLIILDLRNLRGCELIHSSNTAFDFPNILCMLCLLIELFIMSLLLLLIRIHHIIEHFHFSICSVICINLKSSLLFPVQSIIQLTYMNVLVNFKLAVSYVVWRIVDLENLVIPVGYFLMMLSNFVFAYLKISISFIQFVKSSLVLKHILVFFECYLLSYLFLLIP